MPMKKIPLAVAVFVSMVAPAAIAQSSVQIYGRLYPFIVNEDGSGATAAGPSRATLGAAGTGIDAVTRNTSMVSGNSRLGFRGKEDMGGGLKAMFQLETGVGLDDGTAAGGATFWNRDTFVGLESAMGTVRLGLMDTIFKNYGDTIGILGISSGTFMSTSNILRKPGFGTSNVARFHERLPNSIVYESPEISGFQFGLQVAEDSLKQPTRGGKTKAYSMGVKYDSGPIYVALAHEIHKDFFGGSAMSPSALRNSVTDPNRKSTDRATQFTVEYRLGRVHKFEFDVIVKEYKENPVAAAAPRFSSYKNTAVLLAMENRWSDQWRTAANFVKSSAGSCSVVATVATPCRTEGLDGTKLTFAGAYYLSRRTMIFASIAKLTNGRSARFSTAEGPNGTSPGEDLTQFAAGLSHSF